MTCAHIRNMDHRDRRTRIKARHVRRISRLASIFRSARCHKRNHTDGDIKRQASARLDITTTSDLQQDLYEIQLSMRAILCTHRRLSVPVLSSVQRSCPSRTRMNYVNCCCTRMRQLEYTWPVLLLHNMMAFVYRTT